MSNSTVQSSQSAPHHQTTWGQILLVGTLLYFTGLAIVSETNNPISYPLVAFLGSFAVPVAYVAFFYDRRGTVQISLGTIALCFFFGGVLGGFAAALIEPVFVKSYGPVGAFEVGLIEEFAKIIGILLIARHTRHTSMLTGLILGAAAGMGFAAFESTGYSLVTFTSIHGPFWDNLGSIAQVTIARGLLAPIGHGTWTAILAAVLFRQSAPGRFRLDVSVLTAYLGVSLLHGLWDAAPAFAFIADIPGIFSVVFQLLNGAIGLFTLALLWRESKWHQISEDRYLETQEASQ